MAIQLKTPPAVEPVTLAELKSYLGEAGTGDDSFLSQLIVAGRQACEAYTGRALVTQTWVQWLDTIKNPVPGKAGVLDAPVYADHPPRRVVSLPRPPLQSVTQVNTYGVDHQATVFSSANYLVDVVSEPGRLVLNDSAAWPVGLRSVNAVEIEFVAGYGDASAVPDSLKQGLLLWARRLVVDRTWLFQTGERTEGLVEFNRDAIPEPVLALWAPYRIYALNRAAS